MCVCSCVEVQPSYVERTKLRMWKYFSVWLFIWLCAVCAARRCVFPAKKKKEITINAWISGEFMQTYSTDRSRTTSLIVRLFFFFISSHLWGVHYHFVRVLLCVVQHFIELVHIILFFYRSKQLFDMIEKRDCLSLPRKIIKILFLYHFQHMFLLLSSNFQPTGPW